MGMLGRDVTPAVVTAVRLLEDTQPAAVVDVVHMRSMHLENCRWEEPLRQRPAVGHRERLPAAADRGAWAEHCFCALEQRAASRQQCRVSRHFCCLF